jgi:hypothetical protein
MANYLACRNAKMTAASALSLLLIACSVPVEQMASYGFVAEYGPSFDPNQAPGYSDRKLSDTDYEITASATHWTRPSRAEAFALARAGDVGASHAFSYMKVVKTERRYSCLQTCVSSACHPNAANPISVLTVRYAKTRADAEFRPVADIIAAAKATIANEPLTTEAKTAAYAENMPNCDKRRGP